MKNFRTYDLAVEFYQLTRGLGLTGNARDQLDRAARSVALNLAEGYGKGAGKDQRRFFRIAMGSLRESQAVLHMEDLQNTAAWSLLDRLAASLYCLLKSNEEL